MEHSEKKYFQRQVFSLIEKMSGHLQCLIIAKELLTFCDNSDEAYVLSHLLYWCDKGSSRDGYIYKSYHEWEAETGLKKHRVEKSSNLLKQKGFLSTKKKKANGAPTMHYKLNRELFMSAFYQYLLKESGNLKNLNSNISESITKITQEIISKEYVKEKKGTNSSELRTRPISFEEYRQQYNVDSEKIESIEYFLKRYKKVMGKPHPRLKPDQWYGVVTTLFYVYDDRIDTEVSLDGLTDMIDKYFATEFQEGCDYSILHFNHPEIKLHRYYEEAH